MVQTLKKLTFSFYHMLFRLRFRLQSMLIKRKTGHDRYTVISAVYNVEKYLDIFFRSLARQSLVFEKHLHLIMVDDGSTDGSAALIKKWQRKYPKNITYLKKENGGQASARNVGLAHVKTPWVTFIDPDDFVDFSYFEKLDAFIYENSSVAMVSCNVLFFMEKEALIRDTHPLKKRFEQPVSICKASDLGEKIQLSVNSVIFKSALITRHALRFDERIKPNFEDGHFVNRFLLHNRDVRAAFLREVKYYYRKRSDASSSIDTSWQREERYGALLEYGYLALLREAVQMEGEVPRFLQRTVLYDLLWHFKHIVNSDKAVAHLDAAAVSRYKSLLAHIFGYIEQRTIETFDLAGVSYYHKAGLLAMYKSASMASQCFFIDEFDTLKSEMRVHFFYGQRPDAAFYKNNELLSAFVKKRRRHTFLGETFVCEAIVWLRVGMGEEPVYAVADGVHCPFSIRGRLYDGGVAVSEIASQLTLPSATDPLPLSVRLHRALALSSPVASKYRDAWVLLDRDAQADDNAEHLYRHIMNDHPEIKCFFILRRTSHDWARLKKEGFRLVAFGSLAHTFALIHARHLVSSHANGYTVAYLPVRYYRDLIKSKFTFLQHGVTKDDISEWLGSIKIDCMVTASRREYDSIVRGEAYALTQREVVLTGFPRHDALLCGDVKPERLILVMPTWRAALVGESIGKGDARALNPAFYDSAFARHWKAFLHSQRLRQVSTTYGYRIIFFPHANVQPYLSWFDVPAYIEAMHHGPGSMQQLFKRAAVLITDYSSVAFEFAVLRKSMLYYQFDRADIFDGRHTYKMGYFDYERDGFGAVCEDEAALFKALERLLANGAVPHPDELERMEAFFAFHDRNNCQRTYEAILAMESVK